MATFKKGDSLDILAPEGVTVTEAVIVEKPNNYSGNGALVLWFFLFFIVIWLIMWSLNPAFAQIKDVNGQATGIQNNWIVLIASLILALILVFIIWAFRRC